MVCENPQKQENVCGEQLTERKQCACRRAHVQENPNFLLHFASHSLAIRFKPWSICWVDNPSLLSSQSHPILIQSIVLEGPLYCTLASIRWYHLGYFDSRRMKKILFMFLVSFQGPWSELRETLKGSSIQQVTP